MKTFKALLAVLLCILTLSACGGAAQASTDDDISPAKTAREDREEKPNSDKEEKDGDIEDKDDDTGDTSTQTSASATPIPFAENTITYGLTKTTTVFINGDTGEIITTVDKSANDLGSFVEIEYGFAKYELGGGEFAYADSVGNVFDLSPGSALLEYFPTMPADASMYYPYVINGVYIATADEKFYGLKSENGDVLVDAIYSLITPSKDFTYFLCYLNRTNSIISATGETKFTTNDGNIDLDTIPGLALSDYGTYNLTTGTKISDGVVQVLPDSKFLTHDGAVIDADGNVFFDEDTLKINGYENYTVNYIQETAWISPYLKVNLLDERRFDGNILIDSDQNIILSGKDKVITYLYPYATEDKLFILGDGKLFIYDLTDGDLIATITSNDYFDVNYLNYGQGSVLRSGDNLFNYAGEIIAEGVYATFYSYDTAYYEDYDSGLYGIIQKDKIVIEPKYTKVSLVADGEILRLERGAEVTYMLADNLIEIDMPAV
jgi:hypothetical protein